MKKSFRRVLSLLIAMSMLLSMVLINAFAITEADEQTVTISASNVTVEKSTDAQTVYVSLYMDQDAEVSNIDALIRINENALGVALAGGVELAQTTMIGQTNLVEGALSGGISVMDQNAQHHMTYDESLGGYVLAKFPVIIPANTTGTVQIEFTGLNIGDFDNGMGYNLTSTTTTATITITEPSVPEEPEYTDNYYVTVDTSTGTVQNDGVDTVTVTVDVNGLAETYNSASIVLSYDADLLTFNGGECNKTATLEDGQVDQDPSFTADNGTLTIRDFGGELATGGTLYTLTFTTNKGGNAEISLTSAGFSTLKQAEDGNLAGAVCDENSVNVTIQHKVTVDGEAEADYVTPGEDYTYQIPEYNSHDYEYEITVKKDGVTIAAPTIDADGKFTVENVDGALEITITKTAITYYDVTWTDDSDVLREDVKVSEVIAGGSVSFDVPVNGTEVGQFTYTVKVNDGAIEPAKQDSTNEGHTTYTISGINQNIAIEIVKEKITPEEVIVSVEGAGADELVIKQNGETLSKPASVNENSSVTLELTPEIGYKYTVKIGDGAAAEVNGTYTKTFTVTADTTITVTKVWVGDFLNVSQYVQLDGAVLWLVKVEGEKIANTTYAYDENNFFWSSKYNAYCYLIVGNGNTPEDVVAALEGKISVVEQAASEISYNGNVNLSKDTADNAIIDVNDAQLVWNMYSAVYNNISETVTVEKFLEADMDDQVGLSVGDALAVIAKIQG